MEKTERVEGLGKEGREVEDRRDILRDRG